VEVHGEPLRFGAVSMGNPHAVIEVADIDAAQVARIGALLQAESAFPQSVNVGFAQPVSRDRIRLRVYERGVGETLACGSGACAAAAVLMRRGRLDREVVVSLPGGELDIAWPDDTSQILMGGPAAFVFEGEWLQ
jgi:diaminopimelate epimerase